jgi:hypothetical protein
MDDDVVDGIGGGGCGCCGGGAAAFGISTVDVRIPVNGSDSGGLVNYKKLNNKNALRYQRKCLDANCVRVTSLF